jgi:hypothetical protein
MYYKIFFLFFLICIFATIDHYYKRVQRFSMVSVNPHSNVNTHTIFIMVMFKVL